MAMKRQCYSVLTGRTQNFSKSNSTQLNLTQNQPSVVIKQMNVSETKLVEIHCFENARVLFTKQNNDYF